MISSLMIDAVQEQPGTRCSAAAGPSLLCDAVEAAPTSNLVLKHSETFCRLADKLKAAGHNVELSESAGRYLCNYIYFRSLQACTSVPNWHALFVHFPPLDYMNEEQQSALALGLFDALNSEYQPMQIISKL